MGERLSGFIYGTIIALAVLVAGAKAYPHAAGRIAALVAVTSVVFWLAHVYSHSLAHSVAKDEHLSLAELRHIARREASLIEAAVRLGTLTVVAANLGLGVLLVGLKLLVSH